MRARVRACMFALLRFLVSGFWLLHFRGFVLVRGCVLISKHNLPFFLPSFCPSRCSRLSCGSLRLQQAVKGSAEEAAVLQQQEDASSGRHPNHRHNQQQLQPPHSSSSTVPAQTTLNNSEQQQQPTNQQPPCVVKVIRCRCRSALEMIKLRRRATR